MARHIQAEDVLAMGNIMRQRQKGMNAEHNHNALATAPPCLTL